MHPRLHDALQHVLGIDANALRDDTPLAALGWDDAAWLAMRPFVTSALASDTWWEPTSVRTIGELDAWFTTLTQDAR